MIVQRKIKFIYHQLRLRSDLRKALIINFRWANLQSGQREPLFTHSQTISYIENDWVSQLHSELAQISGKLLLNDLSSGVLQRENDEFVMDKFLQHYSNSAILKRFNYYIMYLRVSRLSDITTNDSYTIQPGY